MVAIDLNTRRVLWTSPTLTGENAIGIVFSADGSTVHAVRQGRRYTGMWLLQLDVVTGQQRGELMGVRSTDGRRSRRHKARCSTVSRMACRTSTCSICPRADGQHRGELAGMETSSFVFSPDGKSLVVSRGTGDVFDPKGGFSQIWDAGTGQPTSLLMAAAYTAVYAPSGDRLLTRTDFERSVRDAATGRERGSRVVFGGPSALAPDGRTVLTVSENTCRLWQVSADAEPLSDDGTDKNVSMTGSVAYRRSRGLNTFRGGRLREDGKIAVLLAEGAGGRELIRSVDPTTGRPFGRPALALPRLDRAYGRLQPRRPQFRDREQSVWPCRQRGSTLGRDDGPAATSADALHQLGRRAGIPAGWQSPGRGRLQRTHPVLGYFQRQGNRAAPPSRGDRDEPGLQSGRQHTCGGPR